MKSSNELWSFGCCVQSVCSLKWKSGKLGKAVRKVAVLKARLYLVTHTREELESQVLVLDTDSEGADRTACASPAL